MLRRACVAGQFYPGDPEGLEKAVEGYFTKVERQKALAVISPHAGYIYSGTVAGAVYSSVEIPDDIILIGPNHTGLGAKTSVMTSGKWEIPTGVIDINEEMAGRVVEASPLLTPDINAHMGEHSLEVQLPFLYSINRNIRIVPITVMQADNSELMEMGEAVKKAVADYGKDLLIVVSSDMNHYEPDRITREKDRFAIDKVLSLDAEGLLEVTKSKEISMCGVLPAAIAITAAKGLGAKRAELVKYATSAEVSGDYSRVVGYAGFVIK